MSKITILIKFYAIGNGIVCHRDMIERIGINIFSCRCQNGFPFAAAHFERFTISNGIIPFMRLKLQLIISEAKECYLVSNILRLHPHLNRETLGLGRCAFAGYIVGCCIRPGTVKDGNFIAINQRLPVHDDFHIRHAVAVGEAHVAIHGTRGRGIAVAGVANVFNHRGIALANRLYAIFVERARRDACVGVELFGKVRGNNLPCLAI